MPTQPGAQTKTVVVTGASSGVGRAIALTFARRGWRVALIARSQEGLEGAKTEIENKGGETMIFVVDVSDHVAVSAAADQIVRQCGAIDVWVNNAMVTAFAPIADLAPSTLARITDVTYLGTAYGTMAALKHMRSRNEGTIVQVGSALSYRSIPLQSAYCGAKFAIRGFTDALRSELKHDRSSVRVTMVQLPAVNTQQFDWAHNKLGFAVQPVPPIYQPEAIGEAVYRAAQKAPRELWIGLSAAKAIVGSMLAPGLLDTFLAKKGYQGQITPQVASGCEPDNLMEPPAVAYRTHGRFDDIAIGHVQAVSSTQVRILLFAALIASLLLAFTLGRVV